MSPEPLYPDLPILLVDDEEAMLRSVSAILVSNGMSHIVAVSDGREVLPTLAQQEVAFVLLDLIMPRVSGQDLLEMMTRDYPEMPVVVVTAVNEVETAIDCMRKGAFDYLVKPVDEGRLLSASRHALELRYLRRETELLRHQQLATQLRHPQAFTSIVTANPSMLSIFRYAEAIAGTAQPVLITGETGVGKELIARALHTLSGRSGAFVPVNAAGVDDALFSDTLFGHVRGGYTGAHRDRAGLIERAAGGTLFLDEIGDLSLTSQAKLLRLVQEREYLPLGTDDPRLTDARIVVATNRDLAALQEADRFRKDLYFRLRAHHVHIPPLRERLDDLHLLVDHFLDQAAREMNKKKPTPPAEINAVLGAYHFPGNIRELQALIFDAVSKHTSGILSVQAFGGLLSPSDPAPSPREGSMQFGAQLPTLREARLLLIEEAMRRARDNQSVAARLLGITRQALNKSLKQARTD